MFLPSCICLVLFCTWVDGQGQHEKFPHSADLTKGYSLRWKANSTTITFEIRVHAQGWVGLGFSADGKMFPADMAVGYFSSDGQGHLDDRHSVAYAEPGQDSQYNNNLLSSSKTQSEMRFEFSRALNTHDNTDFVFQPGAPVHVIWAYSNTVPVNGGITYHGTHRGSTVLTLVDSSVPVGK